MEDNRDAIVNKVKEKFAPLVEMSGETFDDLNNWSFIRRLLENSASSSLLQLIL